MVDVTDDLSLDDLANHHLTDKGTLYPSVTRHGYAPIYENYVKKWRYESIRLLEIGICMEYTMGGHSVAMWSDYFKNASIFTFDIVDMQHHPIISGNDRVKFYRGNQEKREDLNSMYNEFGNKKFNFILEDGSHQHHHQMISFGCLFEKIVSGGYYILEDMSIPGIPNCCIRNDDTYLALKEFQTTGKINSQYILPEEKKYLERNIKSIEIYNDIQNMFAVAIITKK